MTEARTGRLIFKCAGFSALAAAVVLAVPSARGVDDGGGGGPDLCYVNITKSCAAMHADTGRKCCGIL